MKGQVAVFCCLPSRLKMSGNIFSLMFNEGGQPKVNQTANSQKQKLNQTNSNP